MVSYFYLYVFPLKFDIYPSDSPCVLHLTSISNALIWSPLECLVKSSVQVMKLLIIVTLLSNPLLLASIIVSNLFSNALSPFSFLSVIHQVSYPHETTSKIRVLYIMILMFLDRRRGDTNILHIPHLIYFNFLERKFDLLLPLLNILTSSRFSGFVTHLMWFYLTIHSAPTAPYQCLTEFLLFFKNKR